MSILNIRTAIALILTGAFISAQCILTSCHSNDSHTPFVAADSDNIAPIHIMRLDKDIETYSICGKDGRDSIIANDYAQLQGYALVVEGSDSIDERRMMFWSTWPATTMFMPEVNRLYDNLVPEEQAIGLILETARLNDLSLPADKFVAVTWGDSHSIIIMEDKETAYIALNHYLGSLNEAYNGWPEYKRKLKTRDMIPVDVAEALVATAYPYEPPDATVLSRLLYEGVLTVAKQVLVPDAPLNLIMGFTADELQQIANNEARIRQQLVRDNRLYSTDEELLSNLFDARPASTVISPDAPGRAARYTGYKIVQSYLDKHPQTTLRDLLSPSFYGNPVAILRDSGYTFN